MRTPKWGCARERHRLSGLKGKRSFDLPSENGPLRRQSLRERKLVLTDMPASAWQSKGTIRYPILT